MQNDCIKEKWMGFEFMMSPFMGSQAGFYFCQTLMCFKTCMPLWKHTTIRTISNAHYLWWSTLEPLIWPEDWVQMGFCKTIQFYLNSNNKASQVYEELKQGRFCLLTYQMFPLYIWLDNLLVPLTNCFKTAANDPIEAMDLSEDKSNLWLSARLQYLQCISNGDTAVLH